MGKKLPRKAERRTPAGATGGGRPPAGAPRIDLPTELRRGLAAFRAGDFLSAAAAWRQASRAEPDPETAARIERVLAEALFRHAGQAANPGRALRDLEDASQLAPTNATYRFHLGLAYQRLGQTRRAIAALEEAVRIAPESERFRFHLALLIASGASSRPDGDAERRRARQVLAESRAPDARTRRLASLLDLRAGDPARASATLAAAPRPSPLHRLALGLAYLEWHERDPRADHLSAARASLEGVYRARGRLGPAARTVATLGLAQAQLAAGDAGTAARAVGALPPSEVPDEPHLRSLYAAINRRLGRVLAAELAALDQAIAAWRRARDAQPGDREIASGLAHLLEVAGTQEARAERYAKAHDLWRSALEVGPDDPARLQRNLALVAERLDRWREAADHWEELLRQWKKSGVARGPRGKEGGPSAADDSARARLAVAYRHLAHAHEELDEPAEAARALERALQSGLAGSPDELDIRRRLSALYRELEEPTKAIEHLRRMLAANPKDVETLLELGGAHGFKGDDRQALDYYEQALALAPENPAVREALASQHHQHAHRLQNRGLGERAVDEFKQAIALEPDDPSHWACLGKAYLRFNRPTEAEAAFKRSTKLAPGDWESRMEIGVAYLVAGDKLAAEVHFRSALRLTPKKALVAAVIALGYTEQDDLAGAEPYLARVLKSRDFTALSLAGQTLASRKQSAAAVPYLERAIAVGGPDELLIDTHLALATVFVLGLREHERADAALAQARKLAMRIDDLASLEAIDDLQEANRIMAERYARTEERRLRQAGG